MWRRWPAWPAGLGDRPTGQQPSYPLVFGAPGMIRGMF